jgi:hypothetical protein
MSSPTVSLHAKMSKKSKFDTSAYSYLHVLTQIDFKNQKRFFSTNAVRLLPGLCELLLNIRAGNLGKKPISSHLKLIDGILSADKKKRLTLVNKALTSGELGIVLKIYLNRYDNRRKNPDREPAAEPPATID